MKGSAATRSLPQPSAGILEGGIHLMPVRVYYEDTDAVGIVYHANYLRFAERARTEMLRAAGVDLKALHDDDGLVFVVHRGEISYLRPARLHDVLVVRSALTDLGGASASLTQDIYRVAADETLGELLVSFRAHIACAQVSGGAARMPRHLRARLKLLITGDGNVTSKMKEAG